MAKGSTAAVAASFFMLVVGAGLGVVGASDALAGTTYEAQVTLENSPLTLATGVALDSSGDLFASDSKDVVELAKTSAGFSAPTTVPFSGLLEVQGVAVDGSGDVFVADLNGGAGYVAELPRHGSGWGSQVTVASGLDTLAGLAVDPSGDVFIADKSHSEVLEVVKGSSGYGTPKALPFTGIPATVTLDSAGDVFAGIQTGSSTGAVVELPKTASGYGTQTTLPFSGLDEPTGLAVDASGDVFESDYAGNDVVELPVSGSGWGTQTTVPFTSISHPEGVAVDSAGDVYAAENSTSDIAVIELPVLPTVTTTTVESPLVGQAYSQSLSASGGTSPYVWSLEAGSLPLGLSLSKSGVITGTATAAGQSTFTVQVEDAVSKVATASLTMSVYTPTCRSDLPRGTVVGMAPTADSRGYWIVSSTGEVAACGDAPSFGSGPQGTAAIATAPSGNGYWLVTGSGVVYSYGSAVNHGGIPATVHLAKPIVAIAADPATGGYWLLGGDGGVFSYDAPFYGSTGNIKLAAPAVGLEATLDGLGYRFVASDGGIFDYGDATFYGSLGGIKLHKPVVGMADDPATGGYWLDAADGGIFAFTAPFLGSTGAITLVEPCVGMTATPDGQGYRFVAADGGIFDFGDAGFYGSAAG